MNRKSFEMYFFLGILLLVLAVVALMFLPYISSLILAATFAIIFEPVHLKILKLVRHQKTIASLLTILCMLIIVLVPLSFFGMKIFTEAQTLYVQVTTSSSTLDPMNNITGQVEKKINAIFPKLKLSINFNDSIEKFFKWFFQNIGPIFSSLAQIFTNFLISLIALYYIFKDGDRLKSAIFRISPLPEKFNNEIFLKMKTAIGSVVRGSLVVAVVQGVIAGTGFVIFGVPNPALWGSVTIIAALIPIIGTATVLAPAIAYLFLFGNPVSAFGLLIWSMTAVGLIDNFLGPKLIERRVKIHPFIILLSVLGGIGIFGPIGFLAGPLAIALLFVLFDIYPALVLHGKEE